MPDKTNGTANVPEKVYLKEPAVEVVSSIPVKTLQMDRYHKRGIPYIKINRSIFYKLSDVLEFMEKNKIKTKGDF